MGYQDCRQWSKTAFGIEMKLLRAVEEDWNCRNPEHCGCKKTFQPAITCSKLTIETLEKGVKYVQS